MDWQSYTAVLIAALAAIWAAYKILRPIVNEFRKKKQADEGCCGCGMTNGSSPCADKKKEA
ncbi:MAG TPA: hypothetical protein VKX17_27110 [Planctomycetota bacterium]|nr:hypothetical protein [Planctomycetota bacterium]